MSETNLPDQQLMTRLRDLSLVDLDALLAGAEGQRYAEILVTYGDDLQDAVRCARQRIAELRSEIAGGPDPLALAEMAPEVRARDGGRDLAERVGRRLESRAAACRAMARFDDLVGLLLGRLFEADRRRASLGMSG
jgi:hypothetical protein